MEDKIIGCRITVEYLCSNIIEDENLLQTFNNDLIALWQFISNEGSRPPCDYADTWKIVKVESIDM